MYRLSTEGWKDNKPSTLAGHLGLEKLRQRIRVEGRNTSSLKRQACIYHAGLSLSIMYCSY